jgi:DNA invertase Pin-like site-specific DNA recombinase
MLTKSQIIDRCKRPRWRADDQELRRLPYKEAVVYGRVSGPSQVRDSKESIREIARLVQLAIDDGYQTNLVPSEVEEWLNAISSGTVVKGVLEDGQVMVDVRDLGISGQLLAEDREGLASLQQTVGAERTGAVYVTEGVSRLSRDRDRILPYQLLKLLKEHNVRVRTPEGVWNPAIDRDWDYLADEFDQAIVELKTMNKRMFRRKAQKAARGEFVGEPVPLGFIVPISGQKPNGQYEYGKYTPHQPHAEVATQLLQEYVRAGGSLLKTMRSVRGLVIPFFPPELRYMEHLTSLRSCRRSASGYEISPNLVKCLATNLKLIGVWRWGSCEPRPDNHPAVVDEGLFAEAFEMASRKGKPKGRGAASDPLEWTGLIYCCNHEEARRVTSHTAGSYYSCELDYKYAKGPSCLYISARFLDEPLSRTVVGQLELDPCIEDIISRLEGDASRQRLDEVRDRQQTSRLERQVNNLKALLPCCVDEATGRVDRKKEAYYWEQIREADKQLQELRKRPRVSSALAAPDYAKLRAFLRALPAKWADYSRSSRNRLLKALIDRVELKGQGDIEATVYWKAGFRQMVIIHRNRSWGAKERLWTDAEDAMLERLFRSSPKEALMAALPRRSWKAIAQKATRLGLTRQRRTSGVAGEEPSSERVDARLSWEEATQLVHITTSGNHRVRWEIQNLNLLQRVPSGS